MFNTPDLLLDDPTSINNGIGARFARGRSRQGLETIRKGKNELDPFGSEQTEGVP